MKTLGQPLIAMIGQNENVGQVGERCPITDYPGKSHLFFVGLRADFVNTEKNGMRQRLQNRLSRDTARPIALLGEKSPDNVDVNPTGI
jgi:hypothetical protein